MVYCILLKSIEMKVEKPQAAFAYYFYVLLLGMTEDISRAGQRTTAITKVTPHMLSHGRVDQAKPCTQRAHVKTATHGLEADTPVGNVHRARFPTVYS